ncbi:MAG: class I SAM-dependent methyltransferase [Verrucomicrobiota bacterium]
MTTPFRASDAADYDERIRSMVPGYDLLHELTGAFIIANAPPSSRILLAGVGTGNELIPLAEKRSDLSFTALDSSAEMLAVAEAKASAAGISAQVEFVHARVEDFTPTNSYDVVVSHLVSHFYPDDGSRKKFFETLSSGLRTGGSLLISEFGIALNSSSRSTYGEWLVERKTDHPSRILTRVESEFHTLSRERFEEILRDCDLAEVETFFTALGVRAVHAIRVSGTDSR